MSHKYIVAPSILNADLLNLNAELTKIQAAGIKWLHIDVMDNHSVPNLTFGPLLIKAIKQKYNFKLDGHMMLDIPDGSSVLEGFEPFITAGIDHVNWKYSSFKKKGSPIEEFRALKGKFHNIKIGLAIDPGVLLEEIINFLPYLDIIVIMSVISGFGGQSFQKEVLNKTRELKRLIIESEWSVLIEMDGGIKGHNAKLCFDAGSDIIVVGTYIFFSDNYAVAVKSLLNET